MRRSKNFCILLKYELEKIMKSRLTIISLIFVVGFSFAQGILQAEETGDYKQRTRESRREIDSRVIDDELLAEMIDAADEYGIWWNESNVTYEDLASWVREIVDYGKPLSDYSSANIYHKRQESINEAISALAYLTEGETEFWREREDEIEKPMVWHSTGEAKALIDIIASSPMVLLFIIAICISQLFAGEVKERTDPLIRASRNGWKMTYAVKVSCAFLFTAAVFLLSNACATVTSLLLWGSNGWGADVQMLLPLSSTKMTIGELFVILLISAATSAILLTAVTSFLSETLKNPIAVMGVMFGGFLAILILARNIPYSFRYLSQVFFMLSPMDMCSARVLYELRLIGWKGHYLPVYRFIPLLYVGISIVLVIAGRVIYLRRDKV